MYQSCTLMGSGLEKKYYLLSINKTSHSDMITIREYEKIIKKVFSRFFLTMGFRLALYFINL